MEVILLQDVEKLGKQHELVKVRPGFGRNFLIPKGFAMIANDSNRRRMLELQRLTRLKEEQFRKELQAVSDKLTKSTVKVGAKVGKDEKLFGTITTLQLAESIKRQLSVEVDRRKILFDGEIKRLGKYEASLELHKDLEPIKIKFEVIAE